MLITTERLRLRSVERADAARLAPIFIDWAVVEWLSSPPWPYSEDDMARFVDGLLTLEEPDRETLLVIERLGNPIGAISYRLRPAGPLQSGPGPMLGYWLGAAHWGRGYMTEAATALIARLFEDPTTDAVYSGYFEANIGSHRVQQKLGFEITGRGLLMSRPQGRELPHVMTVLWREEACKCEPFASIPTMRAIADR